MAPRLRKLTSGPVADRVRMLAIDHPDWGPAQIHREVEAHHPLEAPSLRTIQRFLREFQRPDDSGPWTIADGEPEDAALVLPFVTLRPDGLTWPSRSLAHWIARIRQICPDLADLGLVLHLAAYARRGGEDLVRVQTYLAYAPWRDRRLLVKAAAAGVVGMDVVYLNGFDKDGYVHDVLMARRGLKGDTE